jgi:hypothetical protein
VVRKARIASTAAPSASSFCPRPMNGTERIAAASVARTSSRARLRSGCRGSCPRSGSPCSRLRPSSSRRGDSPRRRVKESHFFHPCEDQPNGGARRSASPPTRLR